VFVSRAITYIAPKIAGVTLEVQTANYSTQATGPGATAANVQADIRNQLNAASLKYSFGKLNLAAAMQTQKNDAVSTANDVTAKDNTAYSANYDFGAVRAFAVYSTDKLTQYQGLQRKQSATEVGVQLPMGKTTLWASAFDGSRTGNDTQTAAATTGLTASNADINGYQVGLRNDLSKRTALYAIYGKQEIKGTASSNERARIESTGVSVGVRHSF
jgi:hypothetical protein